MLVEFSFKNFMSFKDKVTLSLEKGQGGENLDNVISDFNLLKSAAIYGANASGKTNVIKAFTASILMIRNSNLLSIGNKLNYFKPFLFNDDTFNRPSEFEYIFYVNNIKYKYFFSADRNKVFDETLEVYFSQKPTTIFKRINTNEYYFPNDKAVLDSIALKNSENKLFLATSANWNYAKTKAPYLWFNNSIDTFNYLDNISQDDLKEYSLKDSSLKKFAINLLKEADIFIKDIDVLYEEIENDSTFNNNIKDKLKSQFVKIEFEHEIKENDLIKTFKLNLSDESSGTISLFSFAPYLKRAFEEQRVLIIDELEKNLHPTLVEHLVKIFNNKNINRCNSQLIFTTHDTLLLNLALFRRDQIWFTEKDEKTSSSDLYPLDSFSVRKDENIMKGYINGRYGAVPFIRDYD